MTRTRSIKLAVMVGWLLASSALVAQHDIQWVQSSGEAYKGQIVSLHLYVPESKTYDSLNIQVIGKGLIQNVSHQATWEWKGVIRSDSVLKFDARITTKETFSAVALIRSSRKSEEQNVLSVVSSPNYAVEADQQSIWTYLPNVITTLLAFFGGMLAFVLQKRFDLWNKKREVTTDLNRAFIKYLRFELSDHEIALKTFSAGAQPWVLKTIGHNSLLGTPGATGFLNSITRQKFSKELKQYYTEVYQFNKWVNQFNGLPPDEKKSKNGEHQNMISRLMTSLDNLLTKTD